MVESLYRIYDRQNVLASYISFNRPVCAWISMIEKKIYLLDKESTHVWPIFIVPFLNANVFNGGVSHFEQWKFLKSFIFIRISIAGIANVF